MGLAELFKEVHDKVAVRLEMDSDSARRVLQTRGPAGLKHIEIRFLAMQQWIGERRPSVVLVDAKSNTVDIFTIFYRDHKRSRYPRNLGYSSLERRTTESNGWLNRQRRGLGFLLAAVYDILFFFFSCAR